MSWNVTFDDEFSSWLSGLDEPLQDEILAHAALSWGSMDRVSADLSWTRSKARASRI